ncbi:MAG: hypothetical protein OXC44_07160 [Proteobacteria bacterium]|nr:hypothetical protein [Pseudomonadota bacterium]
MFFSSSNPAPSSLTAVQDDSYALIFKKVLEETTNEEDTFQFQTCLKENDQINISSCVTALLLPDGTPVEYGIFPKSMLTLRELEQTRNIKQSFSEEDDTQDPFIFIGGSVILASTMFGVIKSHNAANSLKYKRIRSIIDGGRVLNARLYYQRLAATLANHERYKLTQLFLQPKISETLNQQARQRLLELDQELIYRINNGRNVDGVMTDISHIFDTMNYQSDTTFTMDLPGYTAQRQLLQRAKSFHKRSWRSGGNIRYMQAASTTRHIKELAKQGYYEIATSMWRNMKDEWILDTEDAIIVDRDLRPYKLTPLRSSRLQQKFQTLYNQGLAMLAEGKDMSRFLDGEITSIRYEMIEFRGLKVGTLTDGKMFDMWQDLHRQAKAKGLLGHLKKATTPASPALSATALKKPPQTVSAPKLSHGGKIISSKGIKLRHKALPYLGWGVTLVSGIAIVVAIAEKAKSATMTTLKDLDGKDDNSPPTTNIITKEAASSMPYLPVSLYGDYLPALYSLDPNISLEVPSVTQILKTLGLQASYGDSQLATMLSMCFPTKTTDSVPDCHKISSASM